MTARLGELAWIDLRRADRAPILAVPIGSCEQHGPHLPLDTDTRIAVALADALVQSFDPGEIAVAPPIAVSASGEHAGPLPARLEPAAGALAVVVPTTAQAPPAT